MKDKLLEIVFVVMICGLFSCSCEDETIKDKDTSYDILSEYIVLNAENRWDLIITRGEVERNKISLEYFYQLKDEIDKVNEQLNSYEDLDNTTFVFVFPDGRIIEKSSNKSDDNFIQTKNCIGNVPHDEHYLIKTINVRSNSGCEFLTKAEQSRICIQMCVKPQYFHSSYNFDLVNDITKQRWVVSTVLPNQVYQLEMLTGGPAILEDFNMWRFNCNFYSPTGSDFAEVSFYTLTPYTVGI